MIHNIIMPDLGQTVAEGKILRWLKKPGDPVTRGEALLEVETDKVTMEVESYRSGYLRAILVGEGEMASAMSPVAVLTDLADEVFGNGGMGDAAAAGSGWQGRSDPSARGQVPSAPLASLEVAGENHRVAATPAARLRAREAGVDLRTLVASRADGLITRRDLDRALAPRAGLRPAHPMAAVTTKSVQAIPHFYVMVDADVAAALAWRKQWNSEYPDSHLSLNDVFVRAASLALRDLPGLNVRYLHGMVEQRTSADVLLVVATSGGLSWVPVPDPASVGWQGHAHHMRQALKTADQGVPFTPLPEGAPALAISNLGMFGVRQFTAIIPPDSAAMLAVGAVREEPVVRNRQIEIGDRCTLTLAADHRVVDGVTAAKFLERIQIHLKSL
ncbi:MAG TPA: dihydrolipoamide acetyltransferase family protein [Terriglobia bacterium]|nr:dihydrolipoamide acetyltransferase family protein [Terriglobia bacterium]